MQKRVILVVLGLLLSSCDSAPVNLWQNTYPTEITTQSPISGPEVDVAPIQDTPIPISSSTPSSDSNAGGGAPDFASGEVFVQLPLSPDVPPAEVIQQISVFAGGGSGIICESNCVAYGVEGDSNNHNIYLTHFQPNQNIKIDFYSHTGYDPNGYILFEYLTETTAQTDANGSLTIYPDRKGDYFYFPIMVFDEGGNVIFDPEALR